jgi:hypothetical protein
LVGSGVPAFAPQYEPVLSPDGGRIAFNSPFGSPGGVGAYQVYTMNADGTGAALVSIPAGNTRGDAWDPAWRQTDAGWSSPDGLTLRPRFGLQTSTAAVPGPSRQDTMYRGHRPGVQTVMPSPLPSTTEPGDTSVCSTLQPE